MNISKRARIRTSHQGVRSSVKLISMVGRLIERQVKNGIGREVVVGVRKGFRGSISD